MSGNKRTNAGGQTVTATLKDKANYEWDDGTTDDVTFTFTIGRKEIGIQWDATEFLPYTGENKVPGAAAAGLICCDTCKLTTAVVETTEGEGIIPGRWTAKVTELSNSNYKLPANSTATFSIVYGYQDEPTVSGNPESIKGKEDGTITSLMINMEISTVCTNDDAYTKVTDSNMTFAPGTYYVCYVAKPYYNPSPFTTVVITAVRKLNVSVPTEQNGYTLTASVSKLDWNGGATLTFTLANGYSKTNGFEVKAMGAAIADNGDGTYTISEAVGDVPIAVVGVADITAPEAEISVKSSKWNSFLNTILFFKETETVSITATDKGSGVNKIYYHITSDVLTEDQIKALANDKWAEYDEVNKPVIAPDKECVFYVKAVDNAGVIAYVSSNGLVFDGTVPALYGSENGQTYNGDKVFKALDDYLDTVKVDGMDVTAQLNGDNEYKIVADNAEHTVTVTDKAGNVTEYKIKVMKIYTVTFKVDGRVTGTVQVNHGADTEMPQIPAKPGYDQTAPTWDIDGKNITTDTEINAVYTVNEYTVTIMDENGVYQTIKVKHGETMTMPEVPEKSGYTVEWEKVLDTVTGDVTVKAVYTEIPKTETPDSPQTGDNSNLCMWFSLVFASGGVVIMLTVYDRKRKITQK